MSEIEKRYKILVVDDDKDDREHVRIAFLRHYDFYFADSADKMREVLKKDYAIDLVLLDLNLPDPIGIDLIPEIQLLRPGVPIVIMTGDNKVQIARKAFNAGADDFLLKQEYNRDEWKAVLEKALKRRDAQRELKKLKAKEQQFNEKDSQEYSFIGSSDKILEIKRTLQVIADEPNVTVLLLGETGTGKEVAARYLHSQGLRQEQPFIGVNLSAIQDTLLESTLFGSVKGAYTGSTRDVEGYFRQANGGILMLDEIGDINADIQIKLLRFLENRLIRPVGGDKDVRLDVQIVAATHQNLNRLSQNGKFRADLLQRLKSFTVTLPPLRDRKEDILPILSHYLGPNQGYEALIDKAALRLLQDYYWPGNIRELRNAVSYMLLRLKILGRNKINEECLPQEIREYNGQLPILQEEPDDNTQRSREEELELINLRRIEEALRVKNKVKQDAADMLGYKSADSLLYALKTAYKSFPKLFREFEFPYIRASYKQIFK